MNQTDAIIHPKDLTATYGLLSVPKGKLAVITYIEDIVKLSGSYCER